LEKIVGNWEGAVGAAPPSPILYFIQFEHANACLFFSAPSQKTLFLNYIIFF